MKNIHVCECTRCHEILHKKIQLNLFEVRDEIKLHRNIRFFKFEPLLRKK